MRDQLCCCGCVSNAASSSRSIPFIRVQPRKRNPMSSTASPANMLGPQACASDDVSGVPQTINDAVANVIPAMQPLRRPRRSFMTSTFPALLIVLLFALVSTAIASAVPAVTPVLGFNGSSPAYKSFPPPAPTALPGSSGARRAYQQLAAGVTAAQSATAPPNHIIDVQVSQPVMCEYMNITFDPSRGTPPYTVMISIEDYWPVTVSLPSTYDDATKDMWLYQYAVPTFTGNTTNPSLIVSVTDSTGLMSNSSSFVQVASPNAGATCPAFHYDPTYFFYTEHTATLCQDYDIFWNGTDYTTPMTAIFLPESAPPIYVPAPSTATNNMTWQVVMEGGTRFVTTLGDSSNTGSNGGVSRLNIVALNEYFSDSCIADAHYEHRVFAPTTTAAPASIFPDATSTVASLTTSGGVVATVTVIETIKNGRYVHNGGRGGLSSVGFLVLMIVIFVSMGLIGVAIGWYCFRRHQKRKHNIRAWDLPNGDPSVPFSADPHMPIAPGVFGRDLTRQISANAATDARAAGFTSTDRNSVSGTSNYDPVSLSARPLTHAPSTRASLRSWTSSAFDHLHLATGAQSGHQQPGVTTGDYALMNTASNQTGGVSPSETHGSSYGHHARSMTVGTLSNGSREAWSPTDSVPRAFGFYSDDPQAPDYSSQPDAGPQHRTSSPPVASRATSSDGASSKSTRVGPGPTYRPDAASQAAYQNLLASNASFTSGTDRTLPTSARGRPLSATTSPTSRAYGWAEVSENSANSTRVVRHADAGLLLDDNDDGDELISMGTDRLMELPPQYDTIHPGTASQQRHLYSQGQSNDNSYSLQHRSEQRREPQVFASADISDAGNRPAEVHAADLVDEDDDETAFWAH